ncbi:MAG TPA: YihY/virulence factor BrkB family protein [Sporichthyaceae bacterium]|nr:YihY/virulence factor BrkB family protein [Sporichthyaceae bacterium]
MDLRSRLRELDRTQRERRPLAVGLATVKKYGEDSSANLASTIAFWAFFSVFPLLLATVTVLGYVLSAENRHTVMGHLASYLPLIDVNSIDGLHGSWLALILGLASALWSATAVVKVTEAAFNAVWEVPQYAKPKLKAQVINSAKVMGTIGAGLLGSTALMGLVTGSDLHIGILGRLLGLGLAIAVDVGLFIVAYRILTDRQLSTADVLPGAVLAGVGFWLLQTVSGVILSHHASGAQSTYGTFATVITLLWWFYLQAQLTLFGAQLNVVLARDYYPRAMFGGPETDADQRLMQDFTAERQLQEVSG